MRLNFKRRSHKIYGSRTEARRIAAPLPQKYFRAKTRCYSVPCSARHGALYSLLRCRFDGAIIQRAAAPSLRYARLLCRYLRYLLPSSVAMTPRAVAALFCATCAALFSALLFFPRCAASKFILNLKALRCCAKSKFCRFKISTSRLNLKFKSREKFAARKRHKIKFDRKAAPQEKSKTLKFQN